jgi:1,5-anhydro-D-fructose reductase (1,5-anhydro-D-mannitol-forming)
MSRSAGLRWGIIGTGWIVTDFMIGAIRAVPGDEVVSIMSSSQERADAVARSLGIPRAVANLEAFVADPDVDAVYVATRNELHRDQTIACARAGKHVLCDKPLGLSVAECEEMVQACDSAGVVFATNHHIRCLPAIRAMRDVVRSGRIGEPLNARMSFAGSLIEVLRTWRLEGPGAGVELDLTVHSVDTLRFVLDDEVDAVTAIGATQGLGAPGVVDNVMSVLRFSRGTIAGVHDSFTVPANTTSLELYGSEGSLFGHGVIAQSPSGSVELRRDGTSEPVDAGPDVDPYIDTVGAFGAAVRGEGAPRCSGEDGMLNVRAALAVAAAAREAGI